MTDSDDTTTRDDPCDHHDGNYHTVEVRDITAIQTTYHIQCEVCNAEWTSPTPATDETNDFGTIDYPATAPNSAAEWAQHDPAEQDRIRELIDGARILFDSCPYCDDPPEKQAEQGDDTVLMCENGHVWFHDP